MFGIPSAKLDTVGHHGEARKATRSSAYHTTIDESCAVCSAGHEVASCRQFKRMNPEQRMKTVFEKRLCISCLRPGHRINACPMPVRCERNDCRSHHATLLHDAPKQQRWSNRQPAPSQASEQKRPKQWYNQGRYRVVSPANLQASSE